MEHRVSLYLLLGGAEARLQSLRPLLGGAPVGVFCDVLRLLHQLWRIHGLHRDDVEGVQILQRGGQTDRQRDRQTGQDEVVTHVGRQRFLKSDLKTWKVSSRFCRLCFPGRHTFFLAGLLTAASAMKRLTCWAFSWRITWFLENTKRNTYERRAIIR